MKNLERLFETALWNSRLIVLLAVISSALASLAVFYISTVDVWFMIGDLLHYASPALSSADRLHLRDNMVRHIVSVVDGYLLGTVLLIFSLGLYELFISRIDPAHHDKAASRVLDIRNLDDLKTRLAKVVLMILVVRYFEHALAMKFHRPADLIYFAGGIALIGLALYLTHASENRDGGTERSGAPR